MSELGKKQAVEIAKRFENQLIDLVISSPLKRALDTAKTIRNEVKVSALFKENTKPKELVGVSHDDDHFKEVIRKIGEMYLVDPNWHYSDEENFEDLKKRGMEALEFLKSQNKKNILVVSHGNFVALLMGLMMFGGDFEVGISLKLKKFFRFSNTGVSTVIFEDEKWKLQCWNDTSHFLE